MNWKRLHKRYETRVRIQSFTVLCRALDPASRARLLAALAADTSPIGVQLLRLVSLTLATGLRVSELIEARWVDVDLDRKVWRVPASRLRPAREVPLSEEALSELALLLEETTSQPRMFPDMPSAQIAGARFARVAREANVDAHLPNLRAQFRADLRAKGIPEAEIARMLGTAIPWEVDQLRPGPSSEPPR